MRDENFERKAFGIYNEVRRHLLAEPSRVTGVEQWATSLLVTCLDESIERVRADYDAASLLFPFWRNNPPLDRGRSPKGDQFPWIEVGEHAVGRSLAYSIRAHADVRDMAFPTGSDERFVVSTSAISELTNGLFDTVWLLADIKSVGPRDDQDHAVMSHNQVSGSGEWEDLAGGIVNDVMTARGANASHDFFPALPPLVVLPNLSPALVVTTVVKPVYAMHPAPKPWGGQPLARLDVAVIPNGLLLTRSPNLLAEYPGLLFPGKDDKGKDPKKLRARVDFEVLRNINPWRHKTVWQA